MGKFPADSQKALGILQHGAFVGMTQLFPINPASIQPPAAAQVLFFVKAGGQVRQGAVAGVELLPGHQNGDCRGQEYGISHDMPPSPGRIRVFLRGKALPAVVMAAQLDGHHLPVLDPEGNLKVQSVMRDTGLNPVIYRQDTIQIGVPDTVLIIADYHIADGLIQPGVLNPEYSLMGFIRGAGRAGD